MTPDLLVRYLHFLGIIGIAGSLVSQHLLISKEMTPAAIKRVSIVNVIYGVSALLALGADVVVASSLAVPDAEACEVMINLHRHLAGGAEADQALRLVRTEPRGRSATVAASLTAHI